MADTDATTYANIRRDPFDIKGTPHFFNDTTSLSDFVRGEDGGFYPRESRG